MTALLPKDYEPGYEMYKSLLRIHPLFQSIPMITDKGRYRRKRFPMLSKFIKFLSKVEIYVEVFLYYEYVFRYTCSCSANFPI